MKTTNRQGAGAIRAVTMSLALLLLASCSSSTDPGGDPGGGSGGDTIIFSYLPGTAALSVALGTTIPMAVAVSGAREVACLWTINGAGAGTGTGLEYRASQVGVDTVGLHVVADRETRVRTWIFTVVAAEETLPPVVTGISAVSGSAPAEVVVRWLQQGSNREPDTRFLVAVSVDGPITEASWPQATVLGVEPPDADALVKTVTYGEADGLVPGADVWLTVRARDGRGLLSPVAPSIAHTVSSAWSIRVSVRDDRGLPVAGASLAYGGAGPVLTGADGTALIGPLPSTSAVALQVESDLHGHRTVDLAASSGDTVVDITLLNRYAMDHEPCGTGDVPDFLALFRRATRTEGPAGAPTPLWKWAHYPVTVWIPDERSPRLGWDLRSLAGEALAIWNGTMGEDYLVAAADSQSADIVLSFRPLAGYNGYVTVLEPAGPLGAGIPRRVRVEIERELDGAPVPQPVWVTEIALHELGHALGHYGHLCTAGKGNLMDWAGALGSLADGPQDAISPDEWRTVRAVRHLPQGMDTALWEDR